jgi:hypothetical protein
MATYNGDATLVDFFPAGGSRPASFGYSVWYTVPAGHFAEAQIFSLYAVNTDPGGGTFANLTANVGGVSVSAVGDAPQSDTTGFREIGGYPVFMDEGQTIGGGSTNNGNSNYHSIGASVMIKLYKKP